jgi:hypothetical protein
MSGKLHGFLISKNAVLKCETSWEITGVSGNSEVCTMLWIAHGAAQGRRAWMRVSSFVRKSRRVKGCALRADAAEIIGDLVKAIRFHNETVRHYQELCALADHSIWDIFAEFLSPYLLDLGLS